jgi:hypothetical protein
MKTGEGRVPIHLFKRLYFTMLRILKNLNVMTYGSSRFNKNSPHHLFILSPEFGRWKGRFNFAHQNLKST